MMTLGQKLVAYATLVFLNVLCLLFFGALAIVPFVFSIVIVLRLRQM